MVNQLEILTFLSENKEQFRTDFGILKIGLFGSYARNEQTNDSDVDILIEMKSGTEDIFGKRMKLREMLMERFHTNVDVCHAQAIKPIFRDLVFKDAIYA